MSLACEPRPSLLLSKRYQGYPGQLQLHPRTHDTSQLQLHPRIIDTPPGVCDDDSIPDEALTASGQEAIHTVLHSLEFGIPAALTLQVIEKSGQRDKLLASTASVLVWTMIQRGLVNRACQVLTQASRGVESTVANIALVTPAVPRRSRTPLHLLVVAAMPFEEFLGEDALSVLLTEAAMDLIAIEVAGTGTRIGFQMMGYARGSREASLAERA